MRLRYNYRVYPTPGQRIALAKAFGCARVVYNDALRAREQARAQGRTISDGDLSKQVTTQAKRTPERTWLGEVSAVVLQQSLADACAAYRNFWNSVAGARQGPKVAPPRFKSRKDNRQAVRFTRNARFAITPGGKLALPKIGDVPVRWSRALPAEPSSVTVVRDAAGWYYQAICVETLNVVGLAHTRLAKSVHDAGWSQFVSMLADKAARYGRTLTRVNRAFPSSQLCSACGHHDGPKPLRVRAWACPRCGVAHDRDVNAARNILHEGQRIVAAGRTPNRGHAETLNACGDPVRPPHAVARVVEPGTHQKPRAA